LPKLINGIEFLFCSVICFILYIGVHLVNTQFLDVPIFWVRQVAISHLLDSYLMARSVNCGGFATVANCINLRVNSCGTPVLISTNPEVNDDDIAFLAAFCAFSDHNTSLISLLYHIVNSLPDQAGPSAELAGLASSA
jgi:hypothetical protein